MLHSISILSSLLLIIFFLFFSQRNKQKKLWVIFFYIVISFFSDLTAIVFANQFNSFYFYSYFTIMEYSLFSTFYFLTYRSKTSTRILLFCYVVFVIVAIYNFVHATNAVFDSVNTTIEAIFIILLSILFFYEQLNDPEITFVYDTKDFWIVVAFLIYTSATMFVFISTEVLSESQLDVIWPISRTANIIKNVLFCLAFSKPIFKKSNNDRSMI